MTRVVSIRPQPDCFDESIMKEVEINEPLSEEIMRRLATDGKLDFYPDFPRPYFRIQTDGCYVLQGIIGNRTFKVTLSGPAPVQALGKLTDLIQEG